MQELPLLVPHPRRLTLAEGTCSISADCLLVLDSTDPQALRVGAEYLQAALDRAARVCCDIVASLVGAHDGTVIRVSVVPGAGRHPEGYDLTITPEGIYAVAGSSAGAFYAIMTLCQLVEQGGDTLPALNISDWPDFPNRGVMLDISRDKVPTMDTLYQLVEMLASWKVNQLQLYTEHTFAYRNHREVWADASPMTGEEILALDAFCRARFIELVPNQNSFGHMHRWLTHDRYRPLAEVPHGRYETRWGWKDEPFSLCPLDDGSLELVRGLFDEMLPHFSSRTFNVGCDETIDLGLGRSKEEVAERGEGRVYLDFLLKIYQEVKARGRVMQYWGDIIMEHPELVPELPRDAIALEWGYEADHPFDSHGAKFAASGVPFYVCPGVSTWNTVAGRTDNALGNLSNAARNGLKHGAVGFLNTDWGDNGHWQPFPVSFLGYLYGAAVSWCYETNHDLNTALALSHYGFGDKTGTMGRLALQLGNTYQKSGTPTFNSVVFARVLQMEPEAIPSIPGISESGMSDSLDFIDEVVTPLGEVEMDRPDGELIQQEFEWAADMLRHGARRAQWAIGKAQEREDVELRQSLADESKRLIETFRTIWHARNRPGGFRESVARLTRMRESYLA